MTTVEISASNKVTIHKTSLARASLIAGIGLLIMVLTAPVAELYVLPRLIVSANAAETVRNISANQTLFASAIFGYLITFICDLVVAWALYVLLIPVHRNLSLITAAFRWIYTAIALVALLNLVAVLRLLNTSNTLSLLQPDQLGTQVMHFLSAFRAQWHFGLLFFGLHLVLLGYLVIRSKYIPGILGILLIIAGLGYLLTSLKPFLFPDVHLDFAEYTFYGELIFMLWLLIRGSRIKE
jgi:hypothetical protein